VAVPHVECRRGDHLPSLGCDPVDKPLKSVTHGQCDARPTVTFPAAKHNIKIICYLVTAVHVREQLAQGCHLKAERPGIEPATNLSRPTP